MRSRPQHRALPALTAAVKAAKEREATLLAAYKSPATQSVAAEFARRGHAVAFVDSNVRRVDALRAGAQYAVPFERASLVLPGDIDAGVTPPNQHLTMTIAGKPVEMIVVGGDYFVKGMMGDGWVKMPAGAASSMSGSSGDQMSVLTNNKDAFEKIVLVGSEDVSGTPADHYRVTMNLEKIGGSMASASAAKTMTYDAWLDGEGRMLKAVTEMGKITTEATMSKFNEPVTIKAPTEFTEMPS